MIYYERYLGDYARDTTMLSMLEEGAYTRLIDYCYSTEKPLPLDENEVCKIARARTKHEREAAKRTLSKFFLRTADGYVQKRIEQEIERYRIKQDKARKAANTRWNDANAMPTHTVDDADALREQSERNALHPSTSAVNLKPKTKPRVRVDLVGPTRAHAYTREGIDETGSNPLALREIVRAHGLKLTPKIEDSIDAAALEGVTPARLEHALVDAQARADVKTPALYALKTARQWHSRHASEPQAPPVNGTGTPAASPKLSAKEARLLRDDALIDGLTGRSRRAAQRVHDVQDDTLTEVRYVGEEKSS